MGAAVKWLRDVTFIEIVIVGVIISIMAVIVAPGLSHASGGQVEELFRSDLYLLRHMLRAYYEDHGGEYPDPACFVMQLTQRTNARGVIMPPGGSPEQYPYGPYLQHFPVNPYVAPEVSQQVQCGRGAPGRGDAGWYFNVRTGMIFADDDAHSRY